MRDVLRLRDYRLLLVGQTTSMLGDWLLLLVLGMWVKDLTGSNSAAGLVFLALAVPSLLAPLGGWLADRVRRRPLLIATDLATGLVVLSLLFVHDRGQLWLIYAVAALYGLSQTVFSAAMSAVVQLIVPESLLGPANGGLQTVRQSLRLIGPLLGAALYAWHGGAVVAVVDAATFVVSATSLALLTLREERPTAHHGVAFRTQVLAGADHIRRSELLRRLTVASVIVLLSFGLAESVFFALIDGLGKPVEFLSVISTVQGAGAIAAGVTVTAMVSRLGEVRMLVVGLVAATIGVALTATGVLAAVLVGVAIFGAALPTLIVASMTALQKHTPNALMGRVNAAFDVVTGIPYTLSIALGALLVGVLDYRLILGLMAAGLATATCYAALRLPRETATVDEDPDGVDGITGAAGAAAAGAAPTVPVGAP